MKKTILYAVAAATAAIIVVGCSEDFGSADNNMYDFLEKFECGLPKYIITYDANGGDSAAPTPDTVRIGRAINLPCQKKLSKPSFVFTGWNTESSGEGQRYGVDSKYTPTSDITLYADWRVKVTVVAGTGAKGDGGYLPGETVTITAGTNPNGMRFEKWTTENPDIAFADANNATTTFIMPSDTVTVTACFSGVITDSRDNKTYRIVTIIGSGIWMAENLNYAADGSWCYGNDDGNCATYGRLYQWASAMDIDAKYNQLKWDGSDFKQQGVCPNGWHLPSRQEWSDLVKAVGGESTAGTMLKSTSGWNYDGNGTDGYGFTALPGGFWDDSPKGGGFTNVDHEGYWWTATDDDDEFAYFRQMRYEDTDVEEYSNRYKSYGFSVRCVQDN